MKKDISGKEDLKLLVDSFYEKVKANALLGNVFDEVMQVHWETHLPKMVTFWEFILFQTGTYNGKPFPPHLHVNEKVKLTKMHFDSWMQLFSETVAEHFEGPNAGLIQQKANNIQQVWSFKINGINESKNKEKESYAG